MKKNLLFSIITVLVLSSCTKITNTEIGNGLIPPIDGITTTDTVLKVQTYNILLDSIRISKDQDMVLGNIENDPTFGKTQAIINAEFKPPYFPYYFEVGRDSLKIDSVVLVLSYKSIYGDSTKPISYKVYEISQTSPLKADSVYSSTSFFNRASLLGTSTIQDPTLLNDSIHPFREDAINQLRIKLNNSFGNRLLNEFDSSNVYSSDAQFSTTFRGLSIVPQPGSNALIRISLTDTNSKLALYYRYTKRDNSGDSSMVRYFRSGTSNTGASNNIIRTITGSESYNNLTNSTTTEDAELYLQAGQGNYVRIKTPDIKGLSNRAIHRAELIMEQQIVDPAKDTLYKPPFLYLAGISTSTSPDSAAYRFNLPYDVSLGSGGYVSNLVSFGGNPIYKTDALGRTYATYSFNISRYVQSIITRGEKVYDLYLFSPVNDAVYAGYNSNTLYSIYSSALNYPAHGRVKLIGGNSSLTDRRMRLHIVYSKL